MNFLKTKLDGVYVIAAEKIEDSRGFFARSFCQKEFEDMGLNPKVTQCNISYNKKKGTLRGMHYQTMPMAEDKLVRCTRGAIYDVTLDIRPNSSTYREWISVELNEYNHKAVYIPKGLAHGFITLEDDSEVFYQMSEFYDPKYANGVRWNDPAFCIKWPIAKPIISDKDSNYKDYKI